MRCTTRRKVRAFNQDALDNKALSPRAQDRDTGDRLSARREIFGTGMADELRCVAAMFPAA